MLTEETLESLLSAQGRIEGKLDVLLANYSRAIELSDQHNREDDARFAEVNDKISTVNNKLYWFSGIGTAIVALIQYFHFTAK